MSKLYAIMIILATSLVPIIAQDNQDYFISKNSEGQFLNYGTQIPITISESACFESLELTYITKGDKFIIVDVVDEMDNSVGVLIFNKNGEQINYSSVQKEREKYYQYSRCCVFVKELNGLLYFWDVTEPYENFSDYNCFNDSQTDASNYLIPRYYIFDSESGHVETVILKNSCTSLIQDNKLICE